MEGKKPKRFERVTPPEKPRNSERVNSFKKPSKSQRISQGGFGLPFSLSLFGILAGGESLSEFLVLFRRFP